MQDKIEKSSQHNLVLSIPSSLSVYLEAWEQKTMQEVINEIQKQLSNSHVSEQTMDKVTLELKNFDWGNYYPILTPYAVKTLIFLALHIISTLRIRCTLSFSHCMIHSEGIIALPEASQGGNSDVELVIDLFNCYIGTEGLITLANFLSRGPCRLSSLVLSVGQQHNPGQECMDYSSGNEQEGEIHLANAISSPHCPENLVIDFKHLTENSAKQIALAMQANPTCSIQFKNTESAYVQEINFLNKRNERNRLIKKYPLYKETILSFFGSKSVRLNTTDDLVSSSLIFELQPKNTLFNTNSHNLPDEIIKYFAANIRGYNTTTNSVVLTSNFLGSPNLADLTSLSLAIQNNTDFTAFLDPYFPDFNPEIPKILLLLEITALRNQLINTFNINYTENLLLDAIQFNFHLFALLTHKIDLSQEVEDLVIKYISCILSEKTHLPRIERGIEINAKQYSYFSQAVQTGLVDIAKLIYTNLKHDQFLADENDFYSEPLYISAIKSQSKKMIQWLNAIMPSYEKFLNRAAIKATREIIANYPKGDAEQEKLETGLIYFEQVVDEYEKDLVNAAIREKNSQGAISLLSHLKYNKATLIDFLNLAVSYRADRALLELLISKWGKEIELTTIEKRNMVYLIQLKLISTIQISIILKQNFLSFTEEERMELIKPENFPENFLPTFIKLYVHHLTSTQLSYIVQHYELCEELLADLLQLPAEKLIEEDFIQYVYLKFPQNKQLIATILSKPIVSLILQSDCLPMFALLLARGYDQTKLVTIAAIKQLDLISLPLIAFAYPNSQFNNKKLLATLNKAATQALTFLNQHLVLAQKLNNLAVYTFIVNQLDRNKLPLPAKQLDNIHFIQGAIRTVNRITSLYPSMFNNPSNSYSFWLADKSRVRTNINDLEKNIGKYIVAYTGHHEIKLLNGQVLYALSAYTFQHVHSSSNLENILHCAYLLSEKARESMAMEKFPTLNQTYDRAIQDNHLVCTAPFELLNSNHYAKICINLSKLPLSYLQHCIIKMSDYIARDSVFFKEIEIAPAVFMRIKRQKRQNRTLSSYLFTYKDKAENSQTYELTMPGENEIFHGISGFKEALCHFLLIINAIPDIAGVENLKHTILQHLESLYQNNKLTEYLDNIFNYLFKYMEIGFQRGLAFSLDYIESIALQKDDGQVLHFQVLLDAAQQGNMIKLTDLLDKNPTILGKPVIIKALLHATPAYYYQKLATVLKASFPNAYLLYIEGLTELWQKNLYEMRQLVGEQAMTLSGTPRYDLHKLMLLLKAHLTQHHNLRQTLIENFKEEIILVLKEVRNLYANITYVGGNSKMNELFTHPKIMNSLTAKKATLIAAIIALEIEIELNKKPYYTTSIIQTTSQQSLECITITLGSILYRALHQPSFFMELCPLNSDNPHTKYSEIANLRKHVEHQVIFKHFYKKLETGLWSLCTTYQLPQESLNTYLANTEGCYEAYNTNQWENYEIQLKHVVSMLNQNFCKNKNISREVSHGLKLLLKTINQYKTQPSLDHLIEAFLTSSAIIDPQIAHLLFDTTHFGVALSDKKNIDKIPLAQDEKISFYDFILACVNKLNQAGINSAYALTAQQLALRIKMLQFWCKENLIEYELTDVKQPYQGLHMKK